MFVHLTGAYEPVSFIWPNTNTNTTTHTDMYTSMYALPYIHVRTCPHPHTHCHIAHHAKLSYETVLFLKKSLSIGGVCGSGGQHLLCHHHH